MLSIPIDERVALQELVFLYPLFCDSHQFDETCALFTEDCIFDETSVGAHRVHSRTALRELFTLAGDRMGPFMHMCSNHLVSAYAGDTASGRCHVIAEGLFNIDGEAKPFRIFGYYDDHYAKVDGRWLFNSRILKLLVPSQGAAQTVGGITYEAPAARFTSR